MQSILPHFFMFGWKRAFGLAGCKIVWHRANNLLYRPTMFLSPQKKTQKDVHKNAPAAVYFPAAGASVFKVFITQFFWRPQPYDRDPGYIRRWKVRSVHRRMSVRCLYHTGKVQDNSVHNHQTAPDSRRGRNDNT